MATAKKTKAKKPAAKKPAAKKPAPAKKSVAARPPAPKAPAPKAPAAPEVPLGDLVGEVTNFFSGVGVAAITLSGDLALGDKIAIRRAEDNLEMVIGSMQIDRNPVENATAGQEIGVKLPAGEKVHQHNKVYKV